MVMTNILLPVDQKSSSEPLLIKSLIKEMSPSIRCRHSSKTCSSTQEKPILARILSCLSMNVSKKKEVQG